MIFRSSSVRCDRSGLGEVINGADGEWPKLADRLGVRGDVLDRVRGVRPTPDDPEDPGEAVPRPLDAVIICELLPGDVATLLRSCGWLRPD